MPSVPTYDQQPSAPRPDAKPEYLLMAAAVMHEQGRFFQFPESTNIEDRREVDPTVPAYQNDPDAMVMKSKRLRNIDPEDFKRTIEEYKGK